MRKSFKIFALLGASICFSLVLAEGLLQVFFPPEAFRYGWDESFWRAQHMSNACSAALPEDIEIDKHLGWQMRRNFQVEDTTHDENGFRSTVGHISRPAERPIVVIGDSFTYGHGLADHSTYASHLQSLTGRRVVNLGANGYGVDQAVMLWDAKGRPLHPEIVVLGYFTDNFHRNAHRIRELPKPSFVLTPDGELKARSIVACDDLVEGLSTLRLPNLLGWTWRKFLDKTVGPPVALLETQRALSRALLTKLRESVSSADAALVVLLIPHCAYPEDGGYGDWVLSQTKRDCSALGIDCIDFSDMTDAGFYGDNCHWSDAGTRTAAQRIVKAIEGLGGQ